MEVEVGITYIDFVEVDATRSTFQMMGYLFYSWHDPRLAPGLYQEGQLWSPRLEIINAVEWDDGMFPGSYWVDERGKVTYKSRFVATLTTPMDLRRFPFDRQLLKIIVEPYTAGEDEVHLVADMTTTRLSPDAFLDDWILVAPEVVAGEGHVDPSAIAMSRLTFQIEILRVWTYYAWRVLLQLSLLVILSWLIFFIDPADAQSTVGVGVTLLLTVVASGILTDSLLPRIGYRTWLDNFQLICFVEVFVITLQSAVSYHLKVRRNNEHASQQLQRWSRRLVPVLFFLAVAVISL